MNSELIGRFFERVKGDNILTMGLRMRDLREVGRKDLLSFDLQRSRFKHNPDSLLKQRGSVRLPYDDSVFDGLILSRAFSTVGDSAYFLEELKRIVNGPMIFFEESIRCFPLEHFRDLDWLYIISVSNNGNVFDIGEYCYDFVEMSGFRKMFHKPGGVLSKYNTLLPETVKTEVGVFCECSDNE